MARSFKGMRLCRHEGKDSLDLVCTRVWCQYRMVVLYLVVPTLIMAGLALYYDPIARGYWFGG